MTDPVSNQTPTVNVFQKASLWIWLYSGIVTAILIVIIGLAIFGKKPTPPVDQVVATPIVFTNTIYVSKPKPVAIPALNNAILVLKTNANGTFDTNVLVVMSVDEFAKLNGQVIDASNYYVSDITSTIDGDQLIDIHYKNTNIYQVPAVLLKKIMYTPRDNVVSAGYSVCGRLAFGYDRLNILSFNKFGLGLGMWTTFNLVEPSRLWDLGLKVNADW